MFCQGRNESNKSIIRGSVERRKGSLVTLEESKPVESETHILSKLDKCIRIELSPSQKSKLQTLLLKNKEVFGEKVGVSPLITQKIENSSIVFSKPRKLSMSEHEQADHLTAAMLKEGVVRPSSSPYNSPILMVTKKDGSIRFCVDYRKLNKVTKTCKYPLTNVSACYDKLLESYYFTSLDFQSAYWSVPMTEEDKEKRHLQSDLVSSNSMSCLSDSQMLSQPSVISWISYSLHINGNLFYAL